MDTQADRLALHGGDPVKTTPFNTGPKHSLKEWHTIRDTFKRGSIPMTRGPSVMALRKAFCKMTGMKHAVSASSGTAALHTALAALEVGRGDEVITSPITDMGTLTGIMAQNAVPVFADVDPLTLMITPETVRAKMSRWTRAVIVVHLGGMAADARGIVRLCKPCKVAVVEDVAQNYECRQGSRLVGTIGDIGCWSLNESKHIGAGDGGMLLTNKRALARRADLFADKCYDREGGTKDPFFAAYNYRLNDLVAAVCLEQLKRVKSICAKRNKYGTRVDEALVKIPGVNPRPHRTRDYGTYWYYVFHVDEELLGVDNAFFAKALRAEGVSAKPGQGDVLEWPLFKDDVDNPHACGHYCPLYRGKVSYDLSNYPGVQSVRRSAVMMPISEHYTAADVRDIIRAVRKVAKVR